MQWEWTWIWLTISKPKISLKYSLPLTTYSLLTYAYRVYPMKWLKEKVNGEKKSANSKAEMRQSAGGRKNGNKRAKERANFHRATSSRSNPLIFIPKIGFSALFFFFIEIVNSKETANTVLNWIKHSRNRSAMKREETRQGKTTEQNRKKTRFLFT